jgi:hypothetical protein
VDSQVHYPSPLEWSAQCSLFRTLLTECNSLVHLTGRQTPGLTCTDARPARSVARSSGHPIGTEGHLDTGHLGQDHKARPSRADLGM